MKLKAGILTCVLAISILVSVALSMLILYLYYARLEYKLYGRQITMIENLQTAIEITKGDFKEMEVDQTYLFDLYDQESDSISISHEKLIYGQELRSSEYFQEVTLDDLFTYLADLEGNYMEELGDTTKSHDRLLIHEYGHVVHSRLFGPLVVPGAFNSFLSSNMDDRHGPGHTHHENSWWEMDAERRGIKYMTKPRLTKVGKRQYEWQSILDIRDPNDRNTIIDYTTADPQRMGRLWEFATFPFTFFWYY